MSTNSLDRALESARISAEAFDRIFKPLPKFPLDPDWDATVARARVDCHATAQWLRAHCKAQGLRETSACELQWERLLAATKDAQ